MSARNVAVLKPRREHRFCACPHHRCPCCASFNDNKFTICGSCSEPKPGTAAPAKTMGVSAGAGTLFAAAPAPATGQGSGSLLGGAGSLLSGGSGSLLGGSSGGGAGGSLLGAGGASGGSLLAVGAMTQAPAAAAGGSGGASLFAAKPQQTPAEKEAAKAAKEAAAAEALGSYFTPPASAPIKPGKTQPKDFDLTQPLPKQAAGVPAGVPFSWGCGDCEQLGHGDDFPEVMHPMRLAAADAAGVTFARIASGSVHNLGLTAAGRVWAWGCNDDGALGRSDKLSSSLEQVTGGGLGEVRVVAIAAGECHSLALDDKGDVWWWGAYKSREGHMQHDGEGGEKVSTTPTKVALHRSKYGKPVSIASGLNHSIVITDKGVALSWGMGEVGQLGRPVVSTNLRGRRQNRAKLLPNPIHAWNEGERQIASKCVKWARAWGVGFSTYLEDVDGQIWVMGLSNYGQLGLGDADNRQWPELMGPAADGTSLHGRLESVAAGQHFALIVTKDGALYAAGRGDSGQLGVSADASDKPPFAAAAWKATRVPQQHFAGSAVVHAAGAGCFSLALTADGTVWSWGFGEMSQLGNGTEKDEVVPFNVTAAAESLAGKRVLQLAAGGQHSVALVADGEEPGAAAPAAKRARRG